MDRKAWTGTHKGKAHTSASPMVAYSNGAVRILAGSNSPTQLPTGLFNLYIAQKTECFHAHMFLVMSLFTIPQGLIKTFTHRKCIWIFLFGILHLFDFAIANIR